MSITFADITATVKSSLIEGDASGLEAFLQQVIQLVFTARMTDTYSPLTRILAPTALNKVINSDHYANTLHDAPGGGIPTRVAKVDLEPLTMMMTPSGVDGANVTVKATVWGSTGAPTNSPPVVLWRDAWTVHIPPVAPTNRTTCPTCGAPADAVQAECRYCHTRSGDPTAYRIIDMSPM